MEKPEELGDITRLSEHVVRVLGQVKSRQFTLQGTNTYIIGSQNPYILIDTGEGLQSYIPVLASALQSTSNPSQPDISDIILSHWHHDHVGGLSTVLALSRNAGRTVTPAGPTPSAVAQTPCAHHSDHNQLPKVVKKLQKELFTPSPTGDVLHDLSDGQTFKDPSGSILLRVLHTPGHTADSICLYIPQDRALYTADTVLGHGTAVFEDLATYLASLNRMLHFGSAASSSPAEEGPDDIDLEYVSLYPAHGAVVSEGRETIATYIKHRLERETQILGASENGALWTTWDIVRHLYKAYPESLWLPAARGVDLHLRKLEIDRFVKRAGGEGNETKWKLLVSPRSTPSL
ncbi:Metallo-hydrolase/oxidoreductase [Flammula alnicola]|nr:Metallo-hydrolase/oxidoreductase [Flammula alnicola]